MKNILFVSHSAELNGAERMLLQTLRRIDKKKFSPHLILPQPGPLYKEAEKLRIKVTIISSKWWLTEKKKAWIQPFSWMWNLGSVIRICEVIRQENISLVFSNSSADFSGAWAAKLMGIPHLWSIHEILSGPDPLISFLLGHRILARLISVLSTRIMVNSRATQKSFGGERKLRLVYNGLDTDFENQDFDEAGREEFGFEDEDFLIGVVGKIYSQKGQKEVMLAVASLRRSYPQVKLLVVGEAKEKKYYEHLRRWIKEKGLERHIHFTGYRKDVSHVLRLMDLLVVSSWVDSFGLAALEAMAVKTPVLAVKAGGLPEIIHDRINGFLVDSAHPEMIRRALEDILQNPLRMDDVAQTGYHAVRERFSFKDKIKKIEEILDECFKQDAERA
ncbi:MAG: glycosyltransferase family 4 protein [Candidatus Aminicenantes bacterium]